MKRWYALLGICPLGLGLINLLGAVTGAYPPGPGAAAMGAVSAGLVIWGAWCLMQALQYRVTLDGETVRWVDWRFRERSLALADVEAIAQYSGHRRHGDSGELRLLGHLRRVLPAGEHVELSISQLVDGAGLKEALLAALRMQPVGEERVAGFAAKLWARSPGDLPVACERLYAILKGRQRAIAWGTTPFFAAPLLMAGLGGGWHGDQALQVAAIALALCWLVLLAISYLPGKEAWRKL